MPRDGADLVETPRQCHAPITTDAAVSRAQPGYTATATGRNDAPERFGADGKADQSGRRGTVRCPPKSRWNLRARSTDCASCGQTSGRLRPMRPSQAWRPSPRRLLPSRAATVALVSITWSLNGVAPHVVWIAGPGDQIFRAQGMPCKGPR